MTDTTDPSAESSTEPPTEPSHAPPRGGEACGGGGGFDAEADVDVEVDGEANVEAEAERAVEPSAHLLGKVALVTGGAIRVGRAISLRFARAGMDVAFTYRRSEEEARSLRERIERMGRRAAALPIDLADPQAPEHLAAAVESRFDRLDVLVNNASFFEPTPLGGITLETFDRNMAVHARAPLMLIQRLASRLGEHYLAEDPRTMGRVINFIDIHVMGEPLKGFAAYNASKAALKEITMSMAMELAPRVTVNALAPGVVAWAEQYTEPMKREYLRRVPLGRPGSPEDAAAAALYLVRDAHYQTGQIIRLDGGRALT